MSDGADRREARRFNMTLPMRILSIDSNSPELKAVTRDVSYRGLYFLAEAKRQSGRRRQDRALRIPSCRGLTASAASHPPAISLLRSNRYNRF